MDINKNKLVLRPCRNEDAKLLFEWVNEPLVRSNSMDTKNILWENHLAWFDKKIKSVDSYIFILEEKQPVGQIRFDFSDSTQSYLIDFSIDKRFRGQSLGKHIIEMGINAVTKIRNKELKFSAFVKSSNLASLNSFLKNNFYISDEKDGYIFLNLNR